MDRIKTRRYFETLLRRPNETPLMFKDMPKKALNATEQLGEATAGITDLTLSQADLAPPLNYQRGPGQKHDTFGGT